MQIDREEYIQLFSKAQVNPDKLHEIEELIPQIQANKSFYLDVERLTSVPWWCIAIVHNNEASLSLERHLHNGDPLTAQTVHVPQGRPPGEPINGKLPYTWTESAVDALSIEWHPQSWSFSSCFEFLERYNGLGYRKRGLNTPYLWAATNQYDKGLYVADGAFDPEVKSNAIGAAALLKTMEAKGLVAF